MFFHDNYFIALSFFSHQNYTIHRLPFILSFSILFISDNDQTYGLMHICIAVNTDDGSTAPMKRLTDTHALDLHFFCSLLVDIFVLLIA